MKMKAAIVVLLGVLFALAWKLEGTMKLAADRLSQVQELTAKLTNKTAQENLELQAKCSAQAEKVFQKLGYRADGGGNPSATYQSHYNAAMNKCFMALTTTSFTNGTNSTDKFLFDAFEQRTYAEYMWLSKKDKKYWEVPPVICKLTPSSRDARICKSEDEYADFISGYIE